MPRSPLPLLLAVVVATSGLVSPAHAQTRPARPVADLTALDLEQLMQLEVVFAASKRHQNPREIASVVTVVTEQEIRSNSYRTLADILRTVSSFYVSYDRNYSYVGVRGFSQPGDFSSRVLLLVDGLRMNDNIYDMAYVGEEFPIDVSLIDRVEIVRGPSGAVYGSSAFFAVINVVTKSGAAVGGTEIAASAGNLGTYTGRATYGKEFANGVDLLLSASMMEAAGNSHLYFREFDTPSSNGGVADRLDAEGSRKLLGKVSRGPLALSLSYSTRDKVIPTASYGMLFNTGRPRTVDQTATGSLTYERSSAIGSISGRLHAGMLRYDGRYVFDATVPANRDALDGKWAGVDLDGSRVVFTRHVLTAGVEYRNNFQQDQVNYDPEPFVSYFDAKYRSQRLGAFAQDEIRLTKYALLYAGVRHDWFETFGTATSPRLGLILTPDSATTIKLLQGSAFRAPNEYELHYSALGFKLNPDIGPERIQTLEIAAERLLGGAFLVSGSVFRNRIRDLIALRQDSTDDLLVFENRGRIDSRGAELGLGWNRGGGLSGEVTYSWQKTVDHETGVELTNSPRQMAKVKMFGALIDGRLEAGLDAQYVGARRTLAGGEAKPFTVTNLTVIAPRLMRNIVLSFDGYNIFNAAYAYPGSAEHMQDQIPQDGRSYRLKLTLKY